MGGNGLTDVCFRSTQQHVVCGRAEHHESSMRCVTFGISKWGGCSAKTLGRNGHFECNGRGSDELESQETMAGKDMSPHASGKRRL